MGGPFADRLLRGKRTSIPSRSLSVGWLDLSSNLRARSFCLILKALLRQFGGLKSLEGHAQGCGIRPWTLERCKFVDGARSSSGFKPVCWEPCIRIFWGGPWVPSESPVKMVSCMYVRRAGKLLIQPRRLFCSLKLSCCPSSIHFVVAAASLSELCDLQWAFQASSKARLAEDVFAFRACWLNSIVLAL